jgi:hypothetical protein
MPRPTKQEQATIANLIQAIINLEIPKNVASFNCICKVTFLPFSRKFLLSSMSSANVTSLSLEEGVSLLEGKRVKCCQLLKSTLVNNTISRLITLTACNITVDDTSSIRFDSTTYTFKMSFGGRTTSISFIDAISLLHEGTIPNIDLI